MTGPTSTDDVGAATVPTQRTTDEAPWQQARSLLTGLPGGGLNIAYEAVDRHAAGSLADHVALRFLDRDRRLDITYAELREQTDRFANVLRLLGIRKFERVFSLLGRCPELYLTVLGALKQRCVFSPLFPGFGPGPVAQRLRLGDAVVLVTTAAQYRSKVAAARGDLPNLRYVLVTDAAGDPPEGTLDLAALMADVASSFTIEATRPDDPALLHFTSGTGGDPHGAVHVHEAVVALHVTGRLALDLRADDVYWCTADPGWTTGTAYGVIAPLTCGVTTVVDMADMDVERWHQLLATEQVTVWYTAPTALRLLRQSGSRPPPLPALRFLASDGETLSADLVDWTHRAYGTSAHDHWWQTETGAILIANVAGDKVRPGSMGRPLPGVEAAVLRQGEDGPTMRDGHVVLVHDPRHQGQLALRPGWPSMFRGYLHDEELYERCFVDGWYLTGDLVRRDHDGYLWFVGRTDDVITSAGHVVGPFEVESALVAHRAVAEVGVVGRPDPVAGALVVAFVELAGAHEPSEQLRQELLDFARARLGPAVAPSEIVFTDDLPRTSTGKILRRELRNRLSDDRGDDPPARTNASTRPGRTSRR